MSVLMEAGQGAQKPRMGLDLLYVSEVRKSFDCASEVFGFDVAELSRHADQEELDKPINAQVLTMALSVGVSLGLMNRGFEPDVCVGFSVGQISALAVCGYTGMEDAYKILKVRAEAMEEVAEQRPGAMLALLNATPEQAEKLCEECAKGDILQVANWNTPGQIVISGDTAAIDRAEKEWPKINPKGRATRLHTGGAYHTPIMSEAADKVERFCETIKFHRPKFPMLCNTDAKPFDITDAPARLARQLMSAVNFQQS
ncbi:MAG: ACP S-malonyltransferase, partial [Eggerthellaceae bacterium]|nr:ACP S-malonyltransferase [Eggerthellaceae bacterium]